MCFRRLSPLIFSVLALAAAGPSAPVAAQPAAEAGEIELSLELFGVGGVTRPGDWAGFRLAALDRGDRVRPVVVRLSLRDPDGDTARWQRETTLNPGAPQGVWLFARLPFDLGPGEAIRITAHEAPDEPGGATGPEIGSAVVSPQTVIAPTSPLIGVIGRATAGLERYRVPSQPGADDPATGHDWIEFALIDPDQLGSALPDAWMGLAAMKTIVWTEGSPDQVRGPSAEALEEWVLRGGHLVVVVPESGLGWNDPGPIEPLLPEVELVRREGVSLEGYRPLLTPSASAPLPTGAIVHELRARPGAGEQAAMPILAGPAGETVVARRLLGAGAVTMIGIDVADRGVSAWLDAQRFWHRILGERFDVLTSGEIEALSAGDQPANFRSRANVWIDDAVGTLINKTGRAGAGVLLGFVVFVSYWIVAGPGGYALLRWAGWTRHSWLAFVGAAVIFTGIAWGGASALRPVRIEATHLTFVDHVFGQSLFKARSWFSALLPEYGSMRVAIEPTPGRRQALAPWAGPEASADSFPDPRAYAVDARRPEAIEAPSRATVRQFRADWLGAPSWRSIAPLDPIELSPEGRISGSITHGLPAPLTDVVIMLVIRQQDFRQLPPGALQARTLAWRLADPWAPDEPLDLSSLTGAGGSVTVGQAYLDSLTRTARGWADLLSREDLRTAFDKLELLNWGPAIGPPEYRRMTSATGFPAMVHSRLGHGLDLARWFTQPCLIVTGRVAGATPIPLLIEGQTPPSDGQTMLRWVYPLPPDPPTAAEVVQ